MNVLDWQKEVNKRKDELIKDTQNLLRIRSLLDEENATDDAPLGEGVKEALDFMLALGEKDGFTAKMSAAWLVIWNSAKAKKLLEYFVTLTWFRKEMDGQATRLVQRFAMERSLPEGRLTTKAQRWLLITP